MSYAEYFVKRQKEHCLTAEQFETFLKFKERADAATYPVLTLQNDVEEEVLIEAMTLLTDPGMLREAYLCNAILDATLFMDIESLTDVGVELTNRIAEVLNSGGSVDITLDNRVFPDRDEVTGLLDAMGSAAMPLTRACLAYVRCVWVDKTLAAYRLTTNYKQEV